MSITARVMHSNPAESSPRPNSPTLNFALAPMVRPQSASCSWRRPLNREGANVVKGAAVSCFGLK